MDPNQASTTSMAPMATGTLPTPSAMQPSQPIQSSPFMNAVKYAQQNPNSPFATELRTRIQSGQMNDQMKAAGIDYTKYVKQAPTPSPAPQANPNGTAGTFASNVNTDLTKRAGDLASAVTGLGDRAKQIGPALAIPEVGLRAAGAVSGGLLDFATDAVKAIPGVGDFLTHVQKGLQDQQAAADPNSPGQKLLGWLNNMATAHPEITKDLGAGLNIIGAVTGMKGVQEAGAKLPETIAGAKNAVGLGAKTATDSATNEAIANIARQEGGIVAPAKTASQLAQEAQSKTWDVIKPRLTPGEMNDAAASGKIARTGETGVVSQVPTKADVANIKLAQPYVDAANGDPIKTAANIKQGIADEAAKLRDAVGTQGGTFSTSNIKGVVDKVNIPAAIKNGAEMNQVNNIKEFVANIADGVDKNPQGALDLAQNFRQNINSEFGENIWGKGTPISNYIKSVNKALNDFISTRLPGGVLPDGTKIADSFAKQSKLYDIMDNIQMPKLGDAAINPTEAKPLKLPGSPLSESVKKFGNENPITKGVIKAAGRAAGIGAGVHLIP